MTPPMTAANKKSSPRGFAVTGWALLVSVILNLFLVGVVLGTGHHGRHKSLFGPMVLAAPHGEYLVDWVVRYLDPKDADIFRASFQAEADDLKQAHIHVHQATNDLAIVFKQDPPDAAALQKAEDNLAQAKSEENAAVGKILQSAYANLSLEGRRRLADLTQNPM